MPTSLQRQCIVSRDARSLSGRARICSKRRLVIPDGWGKCVAAVANHAPRGNLPIAARTHFGPLLARLFRLDNHGDGTLRRPRNRVGPRHGTLWVRAGPRIGRFAADRTTQADGIHNDGFWLFHAHGVVSPASGPRLPQRARRRLRSVHTTPHVVPSESVPPQARDPVRAVA